MNQQHKSAHSAWETPDPGVWTQQGYIVLRVDERGIGQSPGQLNVLSRGTSETYFDVIEWAAEQEWSTGKVGLLGVSYYAATQWSVAARRPKGLAAIIPWEGFSDYNREAVRHGGILADQFIGRSAPPLVRPDFLDTDCAGCLGSYRVMVVSASTTQPIWHSWSLG